MSEHPLEPICFRVTQPGDDPAASEAHRYDQREVVIGRGDEVDLRLDHSSVSLVHLRLVRRRDGELLVVDVGSTNGSWVDGERLPPHSPRSLAVGARLVLGEVRLELIAPGDALPTSTASLAREAIRGFLSESPEPPRIEVIGGPNQGLVVELQPGVPLIIGRGAGCGLRLSDADVSREHVSLVLSGPGEISVSDLGSKNGFWLAGHHVLEPTDARMGHGDELRLGLSRLRLVVPGNLGHQSAPVDRGGQPGASAELVAEVVVAQPGGAKELGSLPAPADLPSSRAQEAEDRPSSFRPAWRDPLLLGAGGLIVVLAVVAIAYLAF